MYMIQIIQRFRDDELEHLEKGNEHGAEQVHYIYISYGIQLICITNNFQSLIIKYYMYYYLD